MGADVDVLFGERAAARVRPQVALPGQLSVTQLVELATYRVAWAALVTQTNDRAIKV